MSAPERVPYVGLRAHAPSDESWFFGRDAEIRSILAKLSPARFMAIVGTAGSGKTSLLQAGVVPRLLRGHPTVFGNRWRVALASPGGDPFASLARALCIAGELDEPGGSGAASSAETELAELLRTGKLDLADAASQYVLGSGEQLLIAVDGFEQCFGEERAKVARFVDHLLAATRQRRAPVHVLLTLRSERLGDCVDYEGLPEAIQRGQLLLSRLSPEPLSAAIRQPMVAYGAQVDDRLVQRLLADNATAGHSLPRLQHVLMRSFYAWRADSAPGQPLSVEHYERVGGFGRAIESHAEQMWSELERDAGAATVTIAERMFRASYALSSGERLVPRDRSVGELAAIAGGDVSILARIVDIFARPGRDLLRLEPTRWHPQTRIRWGLTELAEHWPRLRTMIAREREFAGQLSGIWDACRRERRGQGSLWRNPELGVASRWLSEERPTPAHVAEYGANLDAIVEFLERSRVAVEAEARGERDEWAARAEKAERIEAAAPVPTVTGGRSRWPMIALALLTVAGASGAGWFWWQREQTHRELERARAEAQAQREQAEKASRDAREKAAEAARVRELAELERKRSEARSQEIERALAEAKAAAAKAEAEREQARERSDMAEQEKLEAERLRLDAQVKHERARALAAVSVADRLGEQPMRQVALLREVPQTVAERLPGWRQLAARALSGLGHAELVLRGHLGDVLDVAISPDARFVVTASADTTAQLWDVHGRPSFELGGHTGPVTQVMFSPDSSRVFTGSADGNARLWNVSTGAVEVEFTGHEGAIAALDISSDASRVATASADGTVRVWPASGQGSAVVLGSKGAAATCVRFSGDGRHVWVGGASGAVHRYPVEGGEGQSFVGHAARVRDLAVSPDGQQLLTASDDGTARLWSADDPSDAKVLPGHLGAVTAVRFLGDGTRMLTASEDDTARVWRADALETPVVLRGHTGAVVAVDAGPNGNTVVTASKDGTARVWDADGRSEALVLTGHRGPLLAVAIDAAGRRIVSASGDDTARVWPVDGKPEPVVLAGPAEPIYAVAIDPTGKRVATGTDDGRVWSWPADGTEAPRELAGHEEAVTGLAFSPDGAWLASVSDDDSLRLWPRDGGEAKVLRGHTDDVSGVDFAADGKRVATASADGTVRIWSLDGEDAIVLSGHDGGARDVAFAPGGDQVATAAGNGIARLWAADGGGDPKQWTIAGGELTAIAWLPDGSSLAAGAADGVVRRWSVAATPELEDYAGHLRDVTGVAFAPDGESFVSASYDGTLRIWPTGRDEPPIVLTGHLSEIYAVAFAADGRRVVSGSQDGTARVWSLGNWHARMWAATTYCLPPEDRLSLLGESDEEALARHADCRRAHDAEVDPQ